MNNLTHQEKIGVINQIKHSLFNEDEFNIASDRMFKDADTNGDDIVDKDELGVELLKIAKCFGFPEPNKDTVELILLKYDKNHDGKIDKQEFKLFFKNALENFLKIAELHK